MKIRSAVLGIAVLGLIAALGCGKSTPTSTGMGWIHLSLSDAAGPFDAVNLVVREVSIHRGDDETGGWEVVKNDTAATFDLLQLRNGVFATLGIAPVPAGHYTQIRLKLDPGSNVVVGGTPFPLTVPSGMQSGYKLVGEFDVPARDSADVMIDFDAARSVHQTGNGRYMLKPTARVVVAHLTGAISGQISPAGTNAVVYALMAVDTVTSTMPGSDGAFLLPSLLPGSYSVAIHPDPAFRDTTLAGVSVTAGMTTPLGVIDLTPSAPISLTPQAEPLSTAHR